MTLSLIARARQLWAWFAAGLGALVGLALVILAVKRRRSMVVDPRVTNFDEVLRDTTARVQLANARAAVEVTAARTKDDVLKGAAKAVVDADATDVAKLHALRVLRERMDRQ